MSYLLSCERDAKNKKQHSIKPSADAFAYFFAKHNLHFIALFPEKTDA
jgi:hypothetical protein